MDGDRLFEEHRRALLFAQLVAGGSLAEKVRNLGWAKDLLGSDAGVWAPDDLIILAEDGDPFLPTDESLQAITSLGLLEYDDDADLYRLRTRTAWNTDLTLEGRGGSEWDLNVDEV